ncbi:MAG TPA: glycosyltransferase [Candidatus Dojkabacteria bacterium]|nr:glycosyltransferase [Candidatus Dojkabacteria bacterium]
MHIVYVYADEAKSPNCTLHNCIFPAEAINKLKDHRADCIYIADFIKNDSIVQEICMESDLIVIERNLFDDTLIMMMYYKVRGKNIAVIFDDAYHLICENNASYDFWGKGIKNRLLPDGKIESFIANPSPMEQFKWGLKMAKGIITPSRILSADWDEYAPTYRTYNYLKLDRYLETKPLFEHPKEEIYIGWSGSMSHYESFTDSGIAGALTFILKKYPQVKLLLTGDKKVFDRINISSDRKLFSGYVPEKDWSRLVASYDIGLAPLATEFDRRRSWIKVLEYMVMKVPWIATNFETYEELREYGTLTKNGLENWKNTICDVIENIEQKRELANGKAYEFALTQSWDNNIQKLLNIFQEIINSKYQ